MDKDKMEKKNFYSPLFAEYGKKHLFPYALIITHCVFNVCNLAIEDDTTNIVGKDDKVDCELT